MVGRVQHSAAFKFWKWFGVFIGPVLVSSYIACDKYQEWQLKTGRRKNIVEQLEVLQEAQIREQRAVAMGTFTFKYFFKKTILERPWYFFPAVFTIFYLEYHYRAHGYWKTSMMKGHSKLFRERREDILRWDPNADKTAFAKAITPSTFLLSHVYLPERTPDGQPQRKPSEHPDFMKYDFVADPEFERAPPPIKVMLMEDIKDIGERFDIVEVPAEIARWDLLAYIGERFDIVEVPAEIARWDLLACKKAVYASPFNLEYYAEKREKYFAEMAKRVRIPPELIKMSELLMSKILSVPVSADTEWTMSREILSAATKSLGLYITEPTIFHLSDVPINGPNPSIEGHLFRFYINLNDKMIVPMLGRISHMSNDESKKSLFPTDDKLLDEPPADGAQLAKFGLTLESVYYSPAGGLNDILAAEGVATFMANRARQQQKEAEEAAREGGGVEEEEGDEQNNRHINEGEGRAGKD
uniref:RIBOSOMAL_L9 domain-containing protein n=1 Tax=Globodera pallida TaxID=36090 RepID=A0A183C6N4_GLOPA